MAPRVATSSMAAGVRSLQVSLHACRVCSGGMRTEDLCVGGLQSLRTIGYQRAVTTRAHPDARFTCLTHVPEGFDCAPGTGPQAVFA
jgi:hypothetical protein